MQLTIEVLPAPLGPMIENSSPSLTPKLTSVSARTPPKRSDTPRTSKACSTHSLHPGASSALCFGFGADEINPVHHDGSICFTGWLRSTVALVAGAVRAQDRTHWTRRRPTLVLDFRGGRVLRPAPQPEGLPRSIWVARRWHDRGYLVCPVCVPSGRSGAWLEREWQLRIRNGGWRSSPASPDRTAPISPNTCSASATPSMA